VVDVFRNELAEEDDDEDVDGLYLRDFLSTGPGFAQDFDLGFAADFRDLGDGEVSILNHFGESGTFTRATTATTVDRNGLVVSVASGVPRSHYDPATGEYLGYLSEGARTNLALRSQEFDDATWTKARATVTANQAVAPDGTATADLIVEDSTAANNHVVQQGNINYSATIYTHSVFVKAGVDRNVFMFTQDGTTNRNAFFNLDTGTVGASSNTTATITAYPGGWYRCTMTSTAAYAATATGTFQVGLADGNTAIYDGNGVGSAYLWGAQLEAAAFASSYIPTTTASVTRNADVLTFTAGNGHVSLAEGTAYAEGVTANGFASGVSQRILSIDNGTSAERITLDRTTSVTPGDAFGFSVITGSSTQAFFAIVEAEDGQTVKYSASYAPNNVAAVVNGGSVSSDATASMPTVTQIAVGHQFNATQWFGGIKNIRIWKRAMPSAQLQAITA
jgi:hypothetical protein